MPDFEPYLTVRAVQPLVAGLEALGHAAASIVSAAGIDPSRLADPDSRVPQRAVSAFWRHALTATGDDFLGLHLGEAAPLESFEVHGYAILSSPTLRAAYRRACRYQRLIHEVNDLELEEGETQGALRHTLAGGRAAARQPAEFLATVWVRLGRRVVATDWSPTRVCFAHPAPADTREHVRIFRAPVQFSSGPTALHVPNAILDAVNPRADPGLGLVLDKYVENVLGQLPRRTTLGDRLRTWLLASLSDGEPRAAAAARALHLSVRSLHRGLATEHLTFRGLLAGLRQEQAAKLLADPRYNLSEVAFLLGFAELSSFHRAFKRWAGTTPAEFRAAARGALPPPGGPRTRA
ncbi:MAG: AraC family transcriptional regulator [Thermoanaerobaculia bacterium]